MIRSGFWLLLLLGVLTAMPTLAAARSSADLYYTRDQIFSGALRFLRIDRGYEVTERDPESAYLLFRYKNNAKTSFGAVEIVETDHRVRLTVKLPELPSYHEQMLKSALLRKLSEDYGPSQAPEPPPRDAADEGEKRPKKHTPKDDTDNKEDSDQTEKRER